MAGFPVEDWTLGVITKEEGLSDSLPLPVSITVPGGVGEGDSIGLLSLGVGLENGPTDGPEEGGDVSTFTVGPCVVEVG